MKGKELIYADYIQTIMGNDEEKGLYHIRFKNEAENRRRHV
jgi:hypothetical protein